MGCRNTKTTPVPMRSTTSDFEIMIEKVQMTWTTIKKIDNLGPKTFAQ